MTDEFEAATEHIKVDEAADWEKLIEDWNATVPPFFERIDKAQAYASEHFPPWEPERWEKE